MLQFRPVSISRNMRCASHPKPKSTRRHYNKLLALSSSCEFAQRVSLASLWAYGRIDAVITHSEMAPALAFSGGACGSPRLFLTLLLSCHRVGGDIQIN
jgi:hypothetical protein